MSQLWNSSVVLGKLLKTNNFNNIVEEEKRERLGLSTQNHFKFNSLRKSKIARLCHGKWRIFFETQQQ